MKWRAGERDQETSHARGARIRAARACRRQFFDSVGLGMTARAENALPAEAALAAAAAVTSARLLHRAAEGDPPRHRGHVLEPDRKSTRLNSSHITISYAVSCLKKK